MLKLRNIQTFYGNIQALKNINMDVKEGEIISLIGANGAGKSTTLMTICGVTRARQGEIHFQGQPIHDMTPDKIVALASTRYPKAAIFFPISPSWKIWTWGPFLEKTPKI